MTSKEIRQQFLDFFKGKEHKIVSSSPVVPFDDPTLLFTNAGMNQFKDVFLAKGTREYKRAVNSQKCIRVSGKHNDLEEVGHDTYHHTFFEMLGNWSFGDPDSPDGIGAGYYKTEAIEWAWELLTKVWKLPKERLWTTVYRTDDEAFNIWKTKTDINPDHILRFDEKDNFWEMGETGPCGPCSEIHINVGDDYDNPKYVNAGVPECIEIWNLVFIQYNRDEKGDLHELPAKHVDTGMGFERVCAILQKKKSNYDTDVFTPLINQIEIISGKKYKVLDTQISMRVIADHIRSLTFAIADGATPSNEGRGYVLRRLLRRAARYGRKINLKDPFLYKLVQIVVDNFSHIFPELKSSQSNIEMIIKSEEESFNATLDRGIDLFNEIITLKIKELLVNKYDDSYIIYSGKEIPKNDHIIKVNKREDNSPVMAVYLSQWDANSTGNYLNADPILNGVDIFKLYDTFGFPVDLTAVMAREKGFHIDEEGFNELMDKQKEKSRNASKLKSVTTVYNEIFPPDLKSKTEFIGYNYDNLKTQVKSINNIDNYLIFDRTPFYAEAGGQVGDTGNIYDDNKKLRILNTIKIGDTIFHEVEKKETEFGNLELIKGSATVQVDEKRRWNIMRNHSATHFLHKALRQVLGIHVQQSGSHVDADYLRFDFTHFEKVKESELKAIESLINEKIRENIEQKTHIKSIEEAKNMGAMMFFGEKYGEIVRVVQFGDFTMEFCGGTHVQNSSQIGLFKIVSESSIASGVRRIEAVTGSGVEKYIMELQSRIESGELRFNELYDEKKKLEKQMAEAHLKENLGQVDSILLQSSQVNGINVYKSIVQAGNAEELKSLGDELRNKINNGVGVLFSVIDEKVSIVCVVSDDLIKEKKLSAGKIVGEIAKLVGGGGGGKNHLATAGGKDTANVQNALSKVQELLRKFL